MILHIIDDEKFLVSAISLFEAIYPGKNVFLVGKDKVGYNDYNVLKNLTKIIVKKINTLEYEDSYIQISKTVNFILFHNIYKTYKLELLRKYSTKVDAGWTFWGAELYGLNPYYNPLLPETKKAYFKSLPLRTYIKKVYFSKLKKHYYWFILKNILKEGKLKYTLTNITEDIDLLESYTNCKTNKCWFTYYNYKPNSIKKEAEYTLKRNVLIGNSSSETNNHLDAFNIIKDKDFTDRKIYIPLNYGDEKYKELVVKQAENFFDIHANPLIEFLSLESYTSIINSCAVLIMNHKRQQGFNTIMMAIANGCKIFMREENTIFKMLKREGFIVFSIQKDIHIKNALEALTEHEQLINLKLLKTRYSKETVLKHIERELQLIIK
ncbi:TDP-N-acetylfucosamine:lipid II N-acetylfucosaminyltransferase [uncultured Zobellia sp.]|uniref:TDP-N-acetylfucosamine:lipid II N-acetylfucosaminyltransferase n=1 Tax=uncultured Zobellia sp. TaxID=255433 RepID=UPI002593FE38|nr:TDP-N-acetylfucosamine:lipid II N-acetylfucosaminyltransferase [uncultured Zobellia sp.]